MRKSYPSWIRNAYVLAILAMLNLTAFAQDRRVTGKVTDASNNGIPGVTVLVKGTQVGANTDGSGNYAINIPGNQITLVFSFVGFKSQEGEIGNRSVLDIQLDEDISTLNEIVVTGYTSERKKERHHRLGIGD